MTLSFSKENIEKRNFINKIWAGLFELDNKKYFNMRPSELLICIERNLVNSTVYHCMPKIHTIRADELNRWKVGSKIHFVMNNRTPQRFQFAPIMEVKAIQKIEIYPNRKIGNRKVLVVFIDDKPLIGLDELESFIKNDGFESEEDFLNYFDSDFHGKIIHWTNFKY